MMLNFLFNIDNLVLKIFQLILLLCKNFRNNNKHQEEEDHLLS